ncbi:MAG: hypothetical protein JNN12_06480 [Bacteroidetes Order II. Incertae sedis bacterium]|nr:hypothetical protein [Bacteroidetes Order II. bacterium]
MFKYFLLLFIFWLIYRTVRNLVRVVFLPPAQPQQPPFFYQPPETSGETIIQTKKNRTDTTFQGIEDAKWKEID